MNTDAIILSLAAIGVVLVVGMWFFWKRSWEQEREQRKKLERINTELRELDEARSDFVAMVAHQLRGPLGGVRSSFDMMLRGDFGPLPPTAQENAALMQKSVGRLLRLAETFLDETKFELGSLQSEPTPGDVRAEIRQIVDELEPFAKMKNVHITVNAESLPPSVTVDHDILNNVLFNVLDNAVKYTENGTITVDARLRDHDIAVSVADTGAGLSADDLKVAFQRFARGRASHSHQQDGTGLGLYIARHLADRARGSISAESAGIGKGSTFILRLPARQAPPSGSG